MYRLLVIFAVLLSSPGPAIRPAFAAVPAAAVAGHATTLVRYGDLDLGRRADRARLDRRISAAIETICGSYAASPPFEERDIGRCRAAARAHADLQLARLPQVAGIADAAARSPRAGAR